MFDISVIIRAHNPRPDYLRRVLNALRMQTLSQDRWELLIVDNASESPLAATYDLSWHQSAKHITEEELGASAALRRGAREASADLLVFVDDDNVLDPDYLAEANRIKREWPILGVWGSGSTMGEFEQEPPEHLQKLIPYLAIRKTDNPRWGNLIPAVEAATPWGAGLCVRANVAKAYCESYEQSTIHISGRRGHRDMLMSGEDVEICYVACKLGVGMGVFPELKLLHLIPKERVKEDYLIKIVEGARTADFLLAYKWRGALPPPFSIRRILSILKNVMIQRGVDRKKYFAELRALFKARRIISESQNY